MREDGLRREGRKSSIDLPRARRPAEGARARRAGATTSSRISTREFYGYHHTEIVALLVPPSEAIEVQELKDLEEDPPPH